MKPNKTILRNCLAASFLCCLHASMVFAQSISTGKLTKQESRTFESAFLGTSYSSKSAACQIAGYEASQFASKNDARDVSLGSCDCSNTKRSLSPSAGAKYYTELGKFYIGNPEVEVFECTRNAKMTIIKTVLN